MSKTLTYKGYSARVEFDAQDRIFVGRIAGVRDIVSFQTETVSGIEVAFKASLDDYLSACEALGQLPDKPAVVGWVEQSDTHQPNGKHDI